MILRFGNIPVPWTASWSDEEDFYVAPCRFAHGHLAICQKEAQGQGEPMFGKPHSQRQRQAIVEGLCDLCGLPLKGRTRVSLSHAMPRQNAATSMDVLQVEPLLHRRCAAISMQFCPALRRDVRAGTTEIRQVFCTRVQLAVMGPLYVSLYVRGYEAKPADRIIGHAKIQLVRAQLRDEAWLQRALS
jgi:hypothetical protein